jgi:hypothetical protein
MNVLKKLQEEAIHGGKPPTAPGFLKGKLNYSGANAKNAIVAKLISMITMVRNLFANVLFRYVKEIIKRWGTVMNVMYIVRILFAILIHIVVIWSSISGGEGTATSIYHVYSILKSVLVILLIIAGIFGVVLGIKRDSQANPTDLLSFELAVISSLLEFIPYVYDLIALVILLGILKAYYIRGCGNKNPNVYPFVDIIIYGPILVFFVATLLTLVFRLFKVDEDVRGLVKSITGPFSSVSVSLLLVYFVLQFFENMVANNLAYWMNLYDGATSSTENCHVGEDENEEDSGLEQAKNIILSVILGILVLIVFIIQLIPYVPLIKVNTNLRLMLQKVTSKLTERIV